MKLLLLLVLILLFGLAVYVEFVENRHSGIWSWCVRKTVLAEWWVFLFVAPFALGT